MTAREREGVARIGDPIGAHLITMSDQLSEYEMQRLAHIRRNHEMLVRLGLVDAGSKPAIDQEKEKGKDKGKAQAPKRTKLPSAPPESLRRSNRHLGVKPEYGEDVVNGFGDEDEEVGGKRKRGKRAERENKENGVEDEDDEDDERADMLESTTAFLRAAREALQQYVSSHDGQAPASAKGWRSEAVQRWGEHVGGGVDDDGGRDWEAFVSSRLSKPPPPSPLDLLQEYYAADVWQLLCCCVLMSRVSSWSTKHRCISDFFEAFPTPSAFLSTVVEANETAGLRVLINSLGLFDDRLKALISITQAFLLGEDTFAVDLKQHKIRGIGEFGHHSFLIFCRDGGATLKANDEALKSFCRWRVKSAAKERDGGAASSSSTSYASTSGVKVE